jgi:hypothetical protein
MTGGRRRRRAAALCEPTRTKPDAAGEGSNGVQFMTRDTSGFGRPGGHGGLAFAGVGGGGGDVVGVRGGGGGGGDVVGRSWRERAASQGRESLPCRFALGVPEDSSLRGGSV